MYRTLLGKKNTQGEFDVKRMRKQKDLVHIGEHGERSVMF